MKMHIRTYYPFFATTLLLVFFFALGCEKDHLPDETIYFQEDILPIMVTSCAESGCHNSNDQRQGLDLTNYDGVMAIVKPGDYKGSNLYTELVKPFGFMPENGDRLPDDEITAIALWIEQGALNNSSGGSGCNTEGTTYNTTVQPIIEVWCYGCHSGSTPIGTFRLDSYAALKAKVDDGGLLGAVRHEPGFRAMPDGGGMLPECDIEKIEKWVADGAPDN